MENIEKTLKYYELLMSYNDTKRYPVYNLPVGYHYEFYEPGLEEEWVKIHLSSGEFTSFSKTLQYFHDYYDSFITELNKRCFFIVTDNGEKVATATVSLIKEDDFTATVDWLAIKKGYQGKGLAKPLISKTIKLAYELGHDKLLLHTQTHTWLAAKLYLDLGFTPYKMTNDNIGWRILKTLTNHEKLAEVLSLETTELYDKNAILIHDQLKKLHHDFTYEIWYKNGQNTVQIREQDIYYEYKYCINKNRVELMLTLTKKD